MKTSLAALISLLGFLALAFFFHVERNYTVTGALWLGMVVLSLATRALRPYIHLLWMVGFSYGLLYLDRHFKVYVLDWPLDFFVLALLGFVFLRFGLRDPSPPLKWSWRFSRQEILSIFIINVPAIFILYWYFINHLEVAKSFPSLPGPPWSLPFAIVLLALLNGLREEIFYRGLIQTMSLKVAPAWYAIALQSVLFGFLHFAHSFPQGWLGIFLTGLWGACIATQYWMFRSIALAWVTHAVADAIMFSIILYSRR
jgi:membrane protease YdiL (CAAX protease family)